MHFRKVFVSNLKLIKILPRDSHQCKKIKKKFAINTMVKIAYKKFKKKNPKNQHCKSTIPQL